MRAHLKILPRKWLLARSAKRGLAFPSYMFGLIKMLQLKAAEHATMIRRHHTKRCSVFTSRTVEVTSAHWMKASLPVQSENKWSPYFYRQHWPRNETPPTRDY